MSSIVKVDTIQENTSANGITVDGLNIKDSKLVTANSVVTSNITADAVTIDKLNLISTSSAPSLEAKGDGSSQDGYIQLNCSQNSHGIKLKSPAHSAGASYTLTFPPNDGDANQVLTTDGSGGLSFTTPASATNTPAFFVNKTDSNQSISNTTDTVITFNNEVFDTANNFSSNVFTPTTAGKYFLFAQVGFESWGDQALGVVYIRNTNSNTLLSEYTIRGSGTASFEIATEVIATANGSSDAFRVEVYQDTGGSKNVFSSARGTYFMGYKIIE